MNQQSDQRLAIWVIAQAFLDWLNDTPLVYARSERERLRAREDAEGFLDGGADLEFWTIRAQLEPQEIIRGFAMMKQNPLLNSIAKLSLWEYLLHDGNMCRPVPPTMIGALVFKSTNVKGLGHVGY